MYSVPTAQSDLPSLQQTGWGAPPVPLGSAGAAVGGSGTGRPAGHRQDAGDGLPVERGTRQPGPAGAPAAAREPSACGGGGPSDQRRGPFTRGRKLRKMGTEPAQFCGHSLWRTTCHSGGDGPADGGSSPWRTPAH